MASVSDFVSTALSYVGTPYVWGGSSPSGFDCSGLVEYVLRKLGVPNVPRTSEQQYAWATPVPPSQLQPGDLVFMNFPGEVSPGHVMIYLGNDKVLQAPGSGQRVKISSFTPKAPGANEWGGQVVGYGRVPGLGGAAPAPQSGGGGGTPSPAVSSAGCLPTVLMIFGVGGCIIAEAMLHFVP